MPHTVRQGQLKPVPEPENGARQAVPSAPGTGTLLFRGKKWVSHDKNLDL